MNIEKAIEVLKHCKDRNFSAFDKIYFDDGTNMCIYQAIETLLTAYEKEKEKNKNIDEFCRKELAFERRLKRENREPDEFNQGRFYVSENIRKIIEEE